LVSYIDEPDGLHVAVTAQQGMTEKAPVERFETVLAAGQSAGYPFRVVRARRRRGSCSATPAATCTLPSLPPPFPPSDKAKTL